MNQQKNNEENNEDLYEFERSIIDDRELFGLDNRTLFLQCPGCSNDKNGNEEFIGKKFFYSRQIPLNDDNVDDEEDGDDGYISLNNDSYTEEFDSTNNPEEIPRNGECISGFETVEDCSEINVTKWSSQTLVGKPSSQHDDHDADVIIIQNPYSEPYPETSRVSLIPLNVEVYKRNSALRKLFELTESRRNIDLNKLKRFGKAVGPYNKAIQRNEINRFPRDENQRKFINDRYYITVYKNKSDFKRFNKEIFKNRDNKERYESHIQQDNTMFDQYIPLDPPEEVILI